MERDQLRQQLAAAEPPPAVPQQTLDETTGIVRDLKQRLRAAEQEVKDYELYKDVMEVC